MATCVCTSNGVKDIKRSQRLAAKARQQATKAARAAVAAHTTKSGKVVIPPSKKKAGGRNTPCPCLTKVAHK